MERETEFSPDPYGQTDWDQLYKQYAEDLNALKKRSIEFKEPYQRPDSLDTPHTELERGALINMKTAHALAHA